MSIGRTFILALAIIGFVNAPTKAKDGFFPSQGMTGIMDHAYTACPKREDFERVQMLFDQNDGTAAALMTLKGNCVQLSQGIPVTIEQTKGENICVRPRLHPTCVWTWGEMFKPTKAP